MTVEQAHLPAGPFRARVKIEDARGRIERVGRVMVSADGTGIALAGNERVARTATAAEVVPIGQQSWVVRTEAGERWTIMAGGCSCGGR